MDQLKGGLGDEHTADTLAAKYKVTKEFVISQIEAGQRVEMEHTSDGQIAVEIAIDHLAEDILYYAKLAAMEGPMDEDGEAAPAAPATPDSIPGMGEPVLAQRGTDGSGDVVGIGTKPKKKSKRVYGFDDFMRKLNK